MQRNYISEQFADLRFQKMGDFCTLINAQKSTHYEENLSQNAILGCTKRRNPLTSAFFCTAPFLHSLTSAIFCTALFLHPLTSRKICPPPRFANLRNSLKISCANWCVDRRNDLKIFRWYLLSVIYCFSLWRNTQAR